MPVVSQPFFQATDDEYDFVVRCDNPIAYWKLGDKTGTTAVDEEGNNNGTYVNTPTLGVTGLLKNYSGTAVSFSSGSSEYVNIPDATELQPGTGDYSVVAWINTQNASQFGPIYYKRQNASPFEHIGFTFGDPYVGTASKKLSVLMQQSGANRRDKTTTADILDGGTHMVAFTWDISSNSILIYVDGEVQSTTSQNDTGTVTDINNPDPVTIASNNGSLFYDGSIGNISSYNYVLTPAQIRKQYLAGIGIRRYQLEVLSDNPLRYWRLGELSGTTAKEEIASNDGTYNGGYTIGTPGVLVGDLNRSAEFDGATGYIQGTNDFGLNGATQFSFEAWIYPNSSTNGYIMGKRGIGTTGYTVFRAAFLSSNLAFYVENGSLQDYPTWDVSSSLTPLNQWSHIVFVWNRVSANSSDGKIYINGVEQTTSFTANGYTGSFTIGDGNTQWRIGRLSDNSGTNQQFDGQIDEVILYDYPLSEDRIIEHYLVGSGKSRYEAAVRRDKPIAYWRLGETSGTTAVDEMGSYDGTYVNSPTQNATSLLSNDINAAVTFNGTNQRIDVSGFSKPSGEDITVACWITSPNTPDATTQQHVIGGANAFGIYWNRTPPSGGIPYSAVIVYNGASIAWASFGTYTPNTTVHLVFTYDGSNLRTYTNGNLITTTPAAGTINAETGMVLMRHNSLTAISNHVEGTLDEVSFYDYALSQSQIRRQYFEGINSQYSPYEKEVHINNPIAYWRLGDSSGTTAVDETGNFDGTYNGTYTLDQPGLLINDNNGAVSFNSGYVEILNTPFGSADFDNFSISVWFILDAFPGSTSGVALFAQGNASDDRTNCNLYIDRVTQTIRFDKWLAGGGFLTSTFSVTTGTLYHIVYTEGTSSRSLYVNGTVDVTNAPEPWAGGTAPDRAWIGRHPEKIVSFEGKIQEVSLFDHVLTSTEIQNLYNAGRDCFRLV